MPARTLEELHEKILREGWNLSTFREKWARMHPAKPPEELEPVTIQDSDIVLGCADGIFDRAHIRVLHTKKFASGISAEVRTLPAIFLGAQGAGKTTLGKYIFAHNIGRRFREPGLLYDTKGEMAAAKEPAYAERRYDAIRPAIDDYLKSISMERRGDDVLTISPRSQGPQPGVDKLFSVGWPDLAYLAAHNVDETVRLFLQLVGIDTSSREASANYVDVMKHVMLRRDSIRKIADMYAVIAASAAALSLPATGERLIRRIKTAVEERYLSDDPRNWIDVRKEMMDRAGTGYVAFRGRQSSSLSHSYVDMQFYAEMMVIFTEVLYDTNDFQRFRLPSAQLRSPAGTWIYVTELPRLAPEKGDSYTRDFVRSFLTEARQAGVDFGGDAQAASMVDSRFFEQFKYVFSARLTESNAAVLRGKHLLEAVIKQLFDLPGPHKTSLGLEPSRWFVVDEDNDNEYIIFDPNPMLSSHPSRLA